MMNTKPELLSPAGGFAQLKAAVQSGADAVYLGAADFSARAGADNFSYGELTEAVKYAHMYNVKVHCALNTLIKENELSKAVEIAQKVYECGVDAIIIQDIGLASHLRKMLPDIELHASTQMTVSSLEGVKYLESKGFSRVVLARELSDNEIEHIVKNSKAEIEVFVHGAICMCYSGQCLISSVLGGRSGNRGRCAQPCRLPYSLLENQKQCGEGYILSPKDMALIKHLDKLKKIGVASLKIEGRLKSPEYVSAVTGIYRKYLDFPAPVSETDMQELKNAFSRSGFTDGYFTATLGKKMMSHSNPSNNSGNIYTKEAKERADGKILRQIPINIFASLREDDVLHITAYDDDGNYVCSEGTEKAVIAQNRPLENQRLVEQLSKLGSTPFYVQSIETELDNNITIPIRDINETRRKLCEELMELRGHIPQRDLIKTDFNFGQGNSSSALSLTAEVTTLEQGEAILEMGGIKRIYAPLPVADKLAGKSQDIEIVTKTSDIFEKENVNTEFVSVSSPAAIYHYGKKAKYGDFRLNIFNSLTANEFSMLECVTLSPELNLGEISDITKHTKDIETEIIGYGHIPLMIMKNCPIKAMGKCQNGKKIYSLKDRKNITFPIMCLSGCKAQLLNSKPVFTADIIDKIIRSGVNCLRLNFTIENAQQCKEIVNIYKSALSGKKVNPPEENTFTRGHLNRGV